ncbi:E set domain-containing protein [Trichocladium antarcticum]|uniref:Rho GDP-dissociation inhibitor n=1 Tax=Trichocladium antarcticum TaxID=1450529 RepID=A0AAN6UK92_9PEZI|nr:E set domain-containing protein [Trichocladium antarcticum]
MAPQDDDLTPENTSGYKLSQPKHSLAEYQKMDEGDESLQRYKESLGLSGGNDLSDPADPRVCIIQSLSMESPGRDPVHIDLTAPGSAENLKKTPFKVKEGATFTMSAQFKVQHEILSGLHYVQVIKRKGIRIPGGKTDEMIGSYAPNTDKQPIYTKKFQEETAPTGWAVRGQYSVSSSFIDDDSKTHLKFDWAFEIDKDW